MPTPVDRAARQDITDLLVRYGTSIDRRDWDSFRSCFTSDCFVDYGRVGVWNGADAVVDWAKEAHANLGPTMHRITNHTMAVTEDGMTARSYFDLVALDANGLVRTRSAGYYDDQVLHTDEGWKINRRRSAMLYLDTTAQIP